MKNSIRDVLRSTADRLLNRTPQEGVSLLEDDRSTDMETRMAEFESLPGMIDRQRGLILYTLAYASSLRGDVVEIGSWQGRSTCYLAQACKDSANGIVRAIDHFRGNIGTEQSYVVGSADLSDLENNFRHNIAKMHLENTVTLYPVGSKEAIKQFPDDFGDVRLLFIDGDHSLDGAQSDIKNYAPKVQPGGLVVLDDYHPGAPGVLEAVDAYLLANPDWTNPVRFRGFFIIQRASS